MGRRSSTRVASSLAIGKKRDASSAATTPGRRSKRLKSASNTPTAGGAKSTPKKSKYFERDSEPSEPPSSPSPSVEESGYKDEDTNDELTDADEHVSEDEHEDDDFSEEDEKPKKRKRGSQSKAKATGGIISTAVQKGKELWRQGVKTGLGPGKQVFVELPKPRGPGKTPYKKDTIHPNTMLFLGGLRENNERGWMKSMFLRTLKSMSVLVTDATACSA